MLTRMLHDSPPNRDRFGMVRSARSPLLLAVCAVLSALGPGCSEDVEGDVPGECSDGADNDSDGYFDCLDHDCSGAPACANQDDDDDDDIADDDDSDDDDDSAEEAGVDVTGRVADSEDLPSGGVGVILCVGGDCRNATANSAGGFLFPDVPPATWVVQNITYPPAPGGAKYAALEYSSFYDLVTVQGNPLDLGTLVPPLMSEWTATAELVDGGTATYFAGSEDELTLSWSAPLEFPAAADDIPADELKIGMGIIPESRWPQGLDGRTPLAAYGFAPWETGLDTDGAFFSFSWTLPAGADHSLFYGFLVADYNRDIQTEEFSFVPAELDVATGTISGEFHHLSMLVVVHD